MSTMTRARKAPTPPPAASIKERVRSFEAALQSATGEDAPLGYLATWNVTPGTLVDHETLTHHLKQNGLERYAPLPIRPKTAMRRALHEMDKDHLVRLMQDTTDYTIYALVDEQVEAEAGMLPDFTYQTHLRMVWWKAEGDNPEDALAFDDEQQGERFRPVVAKYMRGHTSGDISQMLLRMVRAASGVSVRNNGGVYFVPCYAGDTPLMVARALMDELADTQVLGVDSYLSVFAVPDSEAHRNDMRLHVAQDLKADLKRLEDDIREKEQTAREAADKLNSGLDTRATGVGVDTINRYLSVAQAIEDKAGLYVDLLRFNANEIDKRLQSMRKRLHGLAFSPQAPF